MASQPTAVQTAAIPSEAKTAAVVEGQAPVRQLNSVVLSQLGMTFRSLFDRFASERVPVEQRYLKNLRQYMGIYDPDVEAQLPKNRSRAYPRVTRMKCVSMLSRIMSLMFPGNEDNWELNASPSPSMDPQLVAQAVNEMLQEKGANPAGITQDLIDEAIRKLAVKMVRQMSTLIKDQLAELGGDQTIDWITLNRKVADSGIKFGVGLLEGPYIRKVETYGWALKAQTGFEAVQKVEYKPQYDFLSVWDFYPDMSARTLPGEGYFIRKVLGRSALRRLADRNDFFSQQIKDVIAIVPGGNWKAKSWENELKVMGTAAQSTNGSSQASGREKYEVIIWKGPIGAQLLRDAGADVPDEFLSDDVEAELWMVDQYVIKAEVNAWRKQGIRMPMVHFFNFDEDDTSPVGQGLPYVMRDSALSVAATARMVLDNASVVCGPNMEVNTALLRTDQDLTSVQPYKIWYRDDEGLTAQFPAVRRVEVDGHIEQLQGLMKTFLDFAEMETFIGPQTGGDLTKVPSEASRTAAGGSMLRGDAALPFKDIVRNFDSFTQSVIWSAVLFNQVYNPTLAPKGDYDVIPRGATSLVAKEMRGIQIDALSQTLTPEERDHIDERKFVEAKLASRDLQGMMVPEDEAKSRKDARAQIASADKDRQDRLMEATIRDTLAGALKSTTQAQKNASSADKTTVETATTMIEGAQPDANTPRTPSRAKRKPA